LITAAITTRPAPWWGSKSRWFVACRSRFRFRGAARPPVLITLKAKRARAAAGLRTSAAHARWEQIEIGDAEPG